MNKIILQTDYVVKLSIDKNMNWLKVDTVTITTGHTAGVNAVKM